MEIITTLPGRLSTISEYNGFTVKTAQPASSNGDGSAPTPFDLFLISIASCSATYASYFCETRDIPIDDIRIIQKMERDPVSHMLTRITVEVELPADFPDKYIKPMLKSIDMCAVKKLLVDPPEVAVTVTRISS
ncbi:MAG: OsmC family protein [Bacteroidales bacterium]|nr:OsmC family protein [Candidatus Latescibacterota bacterium]